MNTTATQGRGPGSRAKASKEAIASLLAFALVSSGCVVFYDAGFDGEAAGQVVHTQDADGGQADSDSGTAVDGGRDAGTLDSSDATPNDASEGDVGAVDGGAVDGGAVDGGTVDGGTVDGGTGDSGTGDSGTGDSGTGDSGTGDSGTGDAALPDAVSSDAETADGESSDAGTPDSDAGSGDTGGDAADAGEDALSEEVECPIDDDRDGFPAPLPAERATECETLGAAGQPWDCNDDDDEVGACETEDFALVFPGQYRRGSPESESGRNGDETQHRVTLTRPLLVQRTEFTVRDALALVDNVNDAQEECPECPLVELTWFEAAWLANERSGREGLEQCYAPEDCFGWPLSSANGLRYRCDALASFDLDCEGYRLPTDAEWEYVARAGSRDPHLGFEVGEVAWFSDNAEGDLREAGQLEPNAWGLYDVLGNAAEWVFDEDRSLPDEDQVDPIAEGTDNDRGVRGGSVRDGEDDVRVAARAKEMGRDRHAEVGFRLVRTIPTARTGRAASGE